MPSSFTPRSDWVDLPATTTPIRAADLLRYENGIAASAPIAAAWQASTAYKAGQLVTNGGNLWQSNADHTSGTTFSGTTNWTQIGGGSSGAGLPSNIVSKTTAYTAASGDFVEADTTTAGFTVTLPTAPAAGALVAVKKVSSDTNTLTISPAASGTIDGQATLTTVTQWAGVILEHKGSNVWRVAASMSTTGPAGTNGTNGTNGAISVIKDEGTALTVRANLNFIGAGVTATDNATTGNTDVTIPGGGGGGASGVGLRSGMWYAQQGSINTPSLFNGNLYVIPFMVPATTTVTQLAVNATSAVPSQIGRLGIYNDNAGTPSTLLLEATATTQLDLSTTGNKTSPTFSQSLAPGVYWLAFLGNGGGGPALTGTQQAAGTQLGNTVVANAFTNAAISGYVDAGGNSGALPATFNATGIGSLTIAPRIAIKIA